MKTMIPTLMEASHTIRRLRARNTVLEAKCKQLRQEIREGLNNQLPKTERVSAMLAIPEMRQALEATLAKLNE